MSADERQAEIDHWYERYRQAIELMVEAQKQRDEAIERARINAGYAGRLSARPSDGAS